MKPSTEKTTLRSLEEDSSFLSRLFILWPRAIVLKGLKQKLQTDDLCHAPSYDGLERTDAAFRKAFARGAQNRSELYRVLYATFRRRFWFSAAIFLAFNLAIIATPLVLRETIAWFSDPKDLQSGLILLGTLFAFQLVEAVAGKHQWSEAWKTVHSINLLLRSQAYRKLLRLNHSARQKYASGDVLTIFGSDTQRIGQVAFFHLYWAVPVGVIGSCAVLFFLLGWAALIALAVLVAGFLVTTRINDRVAALAPKIRESDASRVGILSEIINGIRIVKAYAWEDIAYSRLESERNRLRALLGERQKLQAMLCFIDAAVPISMATSSLVIYGLLGSEVRASDVFSAIAVLSVLRSQIPEFVRVLDIFNSAAPSADNFVRFMNEPEIEPDSQQARIDRSQPAIHCDQADFSWSPDAEPVLKRISLTIRHGEFVSILGKVGSGKSALIAALQDTLHLRSGKSRLQGRSSTAPQQPWIVNATFEENVRAFASLSDAEYSSILAACALDEDLRGFPGGDRTELGERGTNLSGGQRQRIGLARAAAADAEVYFFDDSLSAVDHRVAQSIVRELILGKLAGRTRIFATHNPEIALASDRVIIIEQGEIVACGTPEELRRRESRFQALLTSQPASSSSTDSPAESAAAPAPSTSAPPQAQTNSPAKFMRSDAPSAASTFSRNLLGYVRLLAPGRLLTVFALLFLVTEAMVAASSAWLARWTGDTLGRTVFYAVIYAGIALAALALERFRFLFSFARGVEAGMELHRKMLKKTLQAPVVFFDSTPSGSIVSRFSSDMETVDLELAKDTIDYLYVTIGALIAATVLVIANPFSLALIIPALAIFNVWQRQARASTVEVARIAKGAKAPLLSLVSETVRGLSVVQSGSGSDWMSRRFQSCAGNARRADYTLNTLSRYFNIRLDYLGIMIVIGSGLIMVLRGSQLPAPMAGLGFGFALTLTSHLRAVLFMLRTVEISLAAYERTADFLDLPTESNEGESKPANWPSAGSIVFENVSMRYRDDLPLVLHQVSFRINPGERFAIMGRTGSGKSSLLQVLYRFVQPEIGRILIDGIDVAGLKLSELRPTISFIPQDPVLFSGTIRSNLDPASEFPDEALLAALGHAHFQDRVAQLPRGLDSPVEEAGANFSVGERQLLCFARAILRGAKIVLMDEATSNVDPDTDSRIRLAVREQLGDCTVIMIAHRNSTAAEADRLLLMDHGRVIRVGAPREVLESAIADEVV